MPEEKATKEHMENRAGVDSRFDVPAELAEAGGVSRKHSSMKTS